MVLISTALVQGQVLCWLALAASLLLSMYDEAKYLYPFHFYERSPSYKSVDPNSKPGSVGDAGTILLPSTGTWRDSRDSLPHWLGGYLQFQEGTHVDSTRGVGFVAGSMWCAAPVVFIRWNDTPEANQMWYWLLAPLFLTLLICTGSSLFGREASGQFHPEKLDLISMAKLPSLIPIAFKLVTRPRLNAPEWTQTRLLAGHLLLFDQKGVTPVFAELHAPSTERTSLNAYADESCKALLVRIYIDAVTTVTVPWRSVEIHGR
eukprot:Skav200475  [mRNA]  locus=scaffold5182:202730:221252:- [translate_table: standard]